MARRLKKLSHSVYECKYHIVFCPKYRYKILESEVQSYVMRKIHQLCGQREDIEVIEWRNRIDAVNAYYSQPDCAGLSLLVERYGVTHVVLQREQFFDGCDSITNIHLDEHYGVFRIDIQ